MQSGYYSSTGGMVVQFNRMDTISSNLANANTTGFKKDNLITGDFQRLFQTYQSELPIQNHTKEAAQYFNRALNRVPQITDSFIDFSMGNIQKTDNPLDLSLTNENQFFKVKTPQGERLTKNGEFTLNEEGKIVNKEGFELLNKNNQSIQLDKKSNQITIDNNGKISTNIPNDIKFGLSNQINIVEVQNLRLLKKEGSNLYINNDITNEKLTDIGSLKQGFIERSNVNPINEMVAMIESNRMISMYQKAMDSQMNDMNNEVIQKIARKG